MDTDFLKRLPGRALWHTPNPFGAAAMLGGGYSLRCVLFHDVSDRLSSFTDGLNVTVTTRAFDEALAFLTRHYTPVTLDDVLHSPHAHTVRRPLLVTFDDAYASVAEHAIPICRKHGVPVLFFVNGRFVDNQDLSLDNLICFVVNTSGLATVSRVASDVTGADWAFQSLRQVFGLFLASLSLTDRRQFHRRLADAAGIRPDDAAREAGLYVTRRQLTALAGEDCEIGNHTFSHVHARTLEQTELIEEIDWNRSVLESTTARLVRSFSVPYGSSDDLPPRVAQHLESRGYEAVFLVERLMNTSLNAIRQLYRVSLQSGTDADLFSEIEVLPRLRALRG